jgi:hypothetical protein
MRVQGYETCVRNAGVGDVCTHARMHAGVWAVLHAQRHVPIKDRPERLSCREGEGECEGEAALEGEGETAADNAESSPSCSCLCSRAASCRHTRRRGPAPQAIQVTANAGRNALRPHLRDAWHRQLKWACILTWTCHLTSCHLTSCHLTWACNTLAHLRM